MTEIQHKADFEAIRYANCWEDADILLQGIGPGTGRDILCIASAGDNALALLSTRPARVLAIDISRPQLCLTELKQTGIACLEYAEFTTLLGLTGQPEESVRLLEKIAPHLTSSTRRYWQDNREMIRKGVLNCGKFEKYFHRFRHWFLPLVHAQKEVHRLLQVKTEEEQQEFFHRHWNSIRWKMLMGLFFSRFVLGRYGRDPEFMRYVDIPVSEYIRRKAEAHLQSAACTRNYFLHYIMTGHFGAQLPFYLREEQYATLRHNIHRLELSQQAAEQALEHRSFDTCYLSNIFEYMSGDAFIRLGRRWQERLPAGTLLAFWNLMAPRSFAVSLPESYAPHNASLTGLLNARDKGFFYSRFVTEVRI